MSIPEIRFGTDGWRGIIAEEFTFNNVKACAQGIVSYIVDQGVDLRPIVVGYDTRFGSHEFARAVAQVVLGNGVPVLLADRPCPTPVISSNIVDRGAVAGIIITASHNPAQWNGVKFRTS